jgi:crotonobetainyl-CoA:carnitine CoA-transferase CaiB-like acyl-CoA transferase
LVAAVARFDSEDWVGVGREGGVPLQPVRTPEEALMDPALVAESAVVDVEHPEHGLLRQVGILYGLSCTPGRVQGPVPMVGEHTDQMRAEVERAPDAVSADAPEAGSRNGAGPLDGVTVLDLGFAVAGPFGTQVLADLGAQAGVTYEDGGCRDGGKPFWSLTSLGDTGNGFLSAIGVIQALYHRKRTGEPQTVDTSILNAGLLVASMASVRADGEALPRPHLDRMQLGLHPLYRLYESADGWICIAALGENHWVGLTAALGQTPLAEDPRFADAATRTDHADELAALLEPIFRQRSGGDLFDSLDGQGVPCEIADGEFASHIFDDPEMLARGHAVEQQHPKLGRFNHFGSTISFSDTPGRIWGPPPIVGQHTRDIMRAHGYETGEIEKLLVGEAVFEDLWVD